MSFAIKISDDMSFKDIFNWVYYKQDIEELADAARRLNTLIQMRAFRAGQIITIDRQARPRNPMTRNASLELDDEIRRKTNTVLRKLFRKYSDLEGTSFQEIVHQELLALEEFKERLNEKRARKSGEIGTESKRKKRNKKIDIEVKFEDEETPSTEQPGSQTEAEPKALVEVILKEPMEAEQQTEPKNSIEVTVDLSGCLFADNLDATCPADEQAEEPISGMKVQLLGKRDKSNPDIVEIEKVFLKFDDNPPTEEMLDEVPLKIEQETAPKRYKDAKTKEPIKKPITSQPSPAASVLDEDGEMPVDEALQTIKEKVPSKDILLLISPVLDESSGRSKFLQITAIQKTRHRMLGSFRIPENSLDTILAEGSLSDYSIVFLSRPINRLQLDLRTIVKHLTRMSTTQLNFKEIRRLFELAEANKYRILAKPDFDSEEPLYVCDFYTATKVYIGTIKIHGADLLKHLKKRPAIVENFEIFADHSDRNQWKQNFTNIGEAFLKKFGIIKLYERMLSFFDTRE